MDKVLCGIQASFEAYMNQPVLVVKREERFHGCTGFQDEEPSVTKLSLDTLLSLGVIQGTKFIGKKRALPTGGRHVRSSVDDGLKPYVVESNISVLAWEYGLSMTLNNPLKLRNPRNKQFYETFPILELEVIFGIDAICAWFQERGVLYLKTFIAMAEELEIMIPQFPELKEPVPSS